MNIQFKKEKKNLLFVDNLFLNHKFRFGLEITLIECIEIQYIFFGDKNVKHTITIGNTSALPTTISIMNHLIARVTNAISWFGNIAGFP